MFAVTSFFFEKKKKKKNNGWGHAYPPAKQYISCIRSYDGFLIIIRSLIIKNHKDL